MHSPKRFCVVNIPVRGQLEPLRQSLPSTPSLGRPQVTEDLDHLEKFSPSLAGHAKRYRDTLEHTGEEHSERKKPKRQHRERGDKKFHGHPVYFKGEKYASVFEAAVGEQLSRYVPGFRLAAGHSYQIPVNERNVFDFRVRGPRGESTMIECHSIRIERCLGPDEYKAWRKNYKSLDEPDRQQMIDITLAEIKDHYFKERLGVLRKDARYRDSKLVVVARFEDLYREVIARFTQPTISEQDFVRESSALKKYIGEHANRHPTGREVDLGYHNKKQHYRRRA